MTRMSHIAVQNEKGIPVISATVSIDDPDDDIFLGVDAKVKIHAASAKDVVTLPVEVVNICLLYTSGSRREAAVYSDWNRNRLFLHIQGENQKEFSQVLWN